MVKRTYKEIMLVILKTLSDGKEHSYGNLERKVNTNWRTIRDHCEILEMLGKIKVTKEGKIRLVRS